MDTALQVHTGEPPRALELAGRPSLGLIRPIAAPAEVIQAQEETRELVKQALTPDRDYGIIPGTDKPTLLKPGAERVALGFGCYYGEPKIIEKEIDHDRVVEWTKTKWVEAEKPENWQVLKGAGEGRNRKYGEKWVWQERREERGTSRGLYRYVLEVPVINRTTGEVVGAGVGSCSTMEAKYIDRPRDCENTALKMAHKRAIVSAALITFGLSDQFTQDVEDLPQGEGRDEGAPAANGPEAKCPKCGGRMWDNRTSKTSPKAPDYKCRDKTCDGTYWPGQWPPASLATAEQKATIAELLRAADLVGGEKGKIERVVANEKRPLTEKRAWEIIAHLRTVTQPAATAAAAAPRGAGLPSALHDEPDDLPF